MDQAEQLVIRRLACLRCGHLWVPNSESKPRVCPHCHSPYWDKARLEKGRRRTVARPLMKVPRSMFGVSPDIPPFKREDDDLRV